MDVDPSISTGSVEDTDVVLVVDLDGTFCRTDTLYEGLLHLTASDPLALRHLPRWMSGGRASFKAHLADKLIMAPESLPLNDDVIEMTQDARRAGRKTALVSAADHRQVTAIAEGTRLFDEAYGSAEGHNLKGAAKAAFLIERYGPKMFDYVGDSKADLPVWNAARKAITVDAGQRLRQEAAASNANITHISPPAGRANAIVKSLRPHQWSKNLLLFLPILAAHDFSTLGQVLVGFLAFCMTASAVYIINDLVDLTADRAHPRKCRRPFASGELSATTGLSVASALLVGALAFGLTAGSLAFVGVLSAYLAATFCYSLWLKRRLIVDVLMLAGLYTIRIIAGGVTASLVLSPWMLGFSMFLFLALAAIKRQAELTDQMATGRSTSGRAYEVEDLPVLRGTALSAGNAAVLVLALYISSDSVQGLYPRPQALWLILPLLLYWLLRMVLKTHRGEMADDPIVFAATDRVSLLVILVCICVAVGAAL